MKPVPNTISSNTAYGNMVMFTINQTDEVLEIICITSSYVAILYVYNTDMVDHNGHESFHN